MTPEVDRLLRLATHGDPETALQLLNALLSGGVDPKMLVEELLAPVQRRLGTLWEEGRVEHAVIQQSTTTMEAALELIEGTMPPAPEMSPRVIIACPPGEWHTLPARMLSTLLRLDRCRTELFGPSTSIEALAAIAAPSDTPLLLSCTMPIALFSASTTIAALHQQRQAVIVGGIAFGPNDSRARTIGADGWAATASSAARLIAAGGVGLHPSGSEGLHRPPLAAVAAIADSAQRILARNPRNISIVREVGISVRELSEIVLWESLARQLGEADFLNTQISWWSHHIRARERDVDVVPLVLEALADASPPGPTRTVLLQTAAVARQGPVADPSVTPVEGSPFFGLGSPRAGDVTGSQA